MSDPSADKPVRAMTPRFNHVAMTVPADLLDEPGRAGIADPVAALVLGPGRPVDTLIVAGEVVVEGGELRTADPAVLAADLARESARLLHRAEGSDPLSAADSRGQTP